MRGARVVSALALLAAGAAVTWGGFAYRQARIDRARILTDAREASAQGEPARAARLLDLFIARHPDDAEAQWLRAEAAQRTGDYNGARNGYLRALAADPRRSDARARLFDLTFQAGARQEAEHHLTRLQELLGANAPDVQQRRKLLDSPVNHR
jgi:Tfp pilus assembly protein PilF